MKVFMNSRTLFSGKNKKNIYYQFIICRICPKRVVMAKKKNIKELDIIVVKNTNTFS